MANTKFWTKKRIIIAVAVLLILIAIVVVAVIYGVKSSEPETALETVTRGSLQSSISSSGTITEVGVAVDVPLYAAVNGIDDADSIGDYRDDFNWADFILNSIYNDQFGNDLPALYYSVISVNPDFVDATVKINTHDPATALFRVAPVVLNVENLKALYQEMKDSGAFDGEEVQHSLLGFALAILLEPGGSDDTLPDDLESFFKIDSDNPIEVTTGYINDIVSTNLGGIDSSGIDYTLSNFRLKEKEWYGVQTKIFKVDFTQVYTSFTVNEYDIAKIDARLRADEKVYAALSVNALNGRKVLSEITEISKGASSGGVSYYGVVARVIFGEVVDLDAAEGELSPIAEEYLSLNPGATGKILDFTYYDSDLDAETVTGLGIDNRDILTRDEVLIGYSVAVRVQQEGIADTLIVPTKCIFYNDANEPYVLVREGRRERRVAVTVTLSTGSDAAVTPKNEGELNEGDSIVYRADDSLLSSILG